MDSKWVQPIFILDAICGTINFLPKCFTLPHSLQNSFIIPNDFIGVAVAASSNPNSIEYVMIALKELAVRNVRVDITYDPINKPNELLIEALAKENYKICLHPVIPLHKAVNFEQHKSHQEEWRTFLRDLFSKFAKSLEYVEIGSTINRYSWTKLSFRGFLKMWQIASEEANCFGIPIIGPNVTDFEPFYNIAVLRELKKRGTLPQIQTNNLFVERATEPEAFDHKIAGTALAPLLKFNLIKKANLIYAIGKFFGIQQTFCSHFSWSLRRVARLLEDKENKQADYLVRYYWLAAASGALGRVYFGPLIGQRDGLIDDGTDEYPEIPTVTFYGSLRGIPTNYRKRKAFYTFKTLNNLMPTLKFNKAIVQKNGLFVLEFVKEIPDRYLKDLFPALNEGKVVLHIVWTTNGKRVVLEEIYDSASIKMANVLSIEGKPVTVPLTVSETPIYLVWNANTPPKIVYEETSIKSFDEFVFTNSDDYKKVDYEKTDLNGKKIRIKGVVVSNLLNQGEAGCPFRKLNLLLDEKRSEKILRKSRNFVWQTSLVSEKELPVVVKEFGKENFLRRILNLKKKDKATRSWNGANELIRRGLSSPKPIAILRTYDSNSKRMLKCYYVCEALDTSFSCRDAFNVYSQGTSVWHGIEEESFYEQVVDFLAKMHSRGVFFRDLSAGNLMVKIEENKKLAFYLIDTARAKFFKKPISILRRLCDLMRLLHPLYWNGRKRFLQHYAQKIECKTNLLFYLPFVYYDCKHVIKKWVRPFRRNKK